MGAIYAVTNQKGGVGKTTTAMNLAACLAEAGSKTLLVDVDPQGNATSGLGVGRDELEHCVYDCLLEEMPVREVILKTRMEGLDLVPASGVLTSAEVELATREGREGRLRTCLAEVKDSYARILVDCPPSLGLLTVNTLVAAERVIIPVQCEYYALEGLGRLLEAIEQVKRGLNPSLEIAGVVLTMADARTTLTHQVIEEVRNFFGEKAYRTVIPRSIRLGEAPSFGKTIIEYDGQSAGAIAYRELAKEVREHG